MKKSNKYQLQKKVMKAAWTIFKGEDEEISFSESLKKAWVWGKKKFIDDNKSLIHKATHQNFKNWILTTVEVDTVINMTDKAAQLKGQIVKGSVWFPLSCINIIDQFTVEVPNWMLKKKGLAFII